MMDEPVRTESDAYQLMSWIKLANPESHWHHTIHLWISETGRMIKRLTFSALLVGLGACTPYVNILDLNTVHPAERADARKVELIPVDADKSGKMAFIAPVEASSCKRLLLDPPPSRTDATEQLQIMTMRLGGNAILDYSCDDTGPNNNGRLCWSTVTCKGAAVKIRK